MRLYEIIEPITTKKTLPVGFDDNHILRKSNSLQRRSDIPSGARSYGGTNKNDPHIFIKKSINPMHLKHDAFYQYIETIKPYMKSNPYFPRVYNVKIKQDKNGRTVPSYDMENLLGPDAFSIEAMEGLADKMFYDFNTDPYSTKHRTSATVFDLICQEIEFITKNNKDTENIKDNKLKEALDIVRDFFKSSREYELDMHDQNFMLRGTPTGPQLVILDPVADMESRSIDHPVIWS